MLYKLSEPYKENLNYFESFFSSYITVNFVDIDRKYFKSNISVTNRW